MQLSGRWLRSWRVRRRAAGRGAATHLNYEDTKYACRLNCGLRQDKDTKRSQVSFLQTSIEEERILRNPQRRLCNGPALIVFSTSKALLFSEESQVRMTDDDSSASIANAIRGL